MASSPDFIGKFRIEGLLGRGAMGIVYKAHDPDIDRTVAVKLVRADLLDGQEHAHYMERFRNEAKVVGRCVHPNIVAIYEFAMHENNPFLVLEYVDGSHIGRYFRNRSDPDLASIGQAVLQVLDALAHAHAFSVIHRDIKPANILRNANGDVKVTDFGISRLLESDTTLSSVLVGTPCYMSPEQCLGQTIDGRSDLFSLGCVLYELIVGERAFDGANYVATTHRILHEAPSSLRDRHPGLPDAILRLVDTALEKRPQDRFASAREMATAMRDALRTLGLATSPSGNADLETIIKPSPRRSSDRRLTMELESIDPVSLETLERRLAHHVGPMARYHLRSVLRQAQSPDELCRRLAEMVPPGKEHDELQGSLLKIVSSSLPLTASHASSVPDGTVDAYAKALAHVVGPIASYLLRRALETVRTPEELENACVELIDQPQQVRQFRELLRRL
jgi:serine/threonine-protein kinase